MVRISQTGVFGSRPSDHYQGCGLGLDVSVSRRSRDVPTSRLGLVSTKIVKVSVSSRSRPLTSRARDQFSAKFCTLQVTITKFIKSVVTVNESLADLV